MIEAAARTAFHPWGPEVDAAALAAFVDAHAESGLRYIALFEPSGALREDAGTPLVPAAPPVRTGSIDPLPVLDLGARVRAYFFRPAGSASAEPRDEDEASSRDGRRGRSSGSSGGQGYLLLEFEPVVAGGVVGGATRGLGLAALAALILTVAALFFWRVSEAYDRARLSLVDQRRLSQLGEMSAVLAHEIRNPLASLKGHAQLLAESMPGGSGERRRADRVVAEAVRLEALTTDLLDFARSAPLRRAATDPLAPVRAAIADLAPNGFEIEAHAPASWPLDEPRIRQALGNLLRNARQASPDGAPVTVRVAQDNEALVYEVRDRGPGLPAGSESRIFDPFFTTRTNGTGLGLAVARRIAEMHGGSLGAGNDAGGGAVFRMVIPRSREGAHWRAS